MIPPRFVRLDDKKAEKSLKEVIDDIYNNITNLQGGVTSTNTIVEKVIATQETLVTSGSTSVSSPSDSGWMLTNDVYVDQYDENFTEKNAVLTVNKLWSSVPMGVYFNVYSQVEGLGDNTNRYGIGGGYFSASDRTGVVAGTKGVLEAGRFEVGPVVDRASLNVDDVIGVAIRNKGSKKGTFGLVIEDNTGITGSQWLNSFRIMGDADTLGYVEGVFTDGVDFSNSTITNGVIILPNNKWITGENAAGGTFLNLISMNSSNNLSLYNGVATLSSVGVLSINDFLSLASGKGVKVNSIQVVGGQQAAITGASTSHSVTAPGDSPASADALRDDIVTNTLSSVNSALDALGTVINNALGAMRTHGLIAT